MIEVLRAFTMLEDKRPPIDIRLSGRATGDTPPQKYQEDALALWVALHTHLPAGTWDLLLQRIFQHLSTGPYALEETREAARSLYEAYKKRSIIES